MAGKTTIYFYGGAGTVTGSNFMVDSGSKKILIDCGLFQGEHALDETNWAPFKFDPKEVSVLLNTHAHIDHIGRIPKLVRDGYTGAIISTEATKAIAEPMLYDAMELNQREAMKHGKEPLYSAEDIEQAMRQWEGIPYGEVRDLGDNVSFEFLNSGHILGSALVKLTRNGRSVVFTGDLGGGNSPLLSLAVEPKGAQYLVIESVYGDRKHPDDTNRRELLENIIEDAIARGGTLLIPAFSTERTQDLLFEIRTLMVEKRIPSVPVYLNSPLADKITAAFLRYPNYFSPEIQKRIEKGEDIFSFPELHFVHDAKESDSLLSSDPIDLSGSKIILAGSGMSNGGRVVGLEGELLPDPKSTLLIVGYQSAGSLGRRLAEGATAVFIQGKKVEVHAKVESMYGYSAHMDGEELLDFVNKMNDTLEEVFVVMGEPASASFLVQRIRDYLGTKATSPMVGEKVEINF